MNDYDANVSDLLQGIVAEEVRRQNDTAERMLRADLQLIGIDPEKLLTEGRMSDRIGTIWQRSNDGGRYYRGLVLDGDLVIDHIWQMPFEADGSGIRRRLIGFVFAGRDAERMYFAREHSLDTRVVLPASEPHRIRGMRVRLIYIQGESAWDGSLHVRDGYRQSEYLVQTLNARNGWPEVSAYGD